MIHTNMLFIIVGLLGLGIFAILILHDNLSKEKFLDLIKHKHRKALILTPIIFCFLLAILCPIMYFATTTNDKVSYIEELSSEQYEDESLYITYNRSRYILDYYYKTNNGIVNKELPVYTWGWLSDSEKKNYVYYDYNVENTPSVERIYNTRKLKKQYENNKLINFLYGVPDDRTANKIILHLNNKEQIKRY